MAKGTKQPATWAISRIKGTAVPIGHVEAPDAETAIKDGYQEIRCARGGQGSARSAAGEISRRGSD
jgi:hypothetical protein